MPLSMMLIVSVILAVGAAMQCFATLTFRPGIFFGVSVDREFTRRAPGADQRPGQPVDRGRQEGEPEGMMPPVIPTEAERSEA